MELLVDGRPVFASNGGRPFKDEQPSVVFLHGAGLDHTVWTQQARWFAHHGRNVIAVDMPGHGRSAGPPLDSVAALAGWTVHLLDAAGCAQAALVGHSLGALAALDAAARFPTRAWALALLGAGPSMHVHPDLLADASVGRLRAAALVADWGFGRRAHVGGSQGPGLWMVASARRLLERNLAALAAGLTACDRYADAITRAAQIRCPVLVVAGAADRMTPAADAAALAGRISGARLVTLPACGHMAMIEQPDATRAALAEIV